MYQVIIQIIVGIAGEEAEFGVFAEFGDGIVGGALQWESAAQLAFIVKEEHLPLRPARNAYPDVVAGKLEYAGFAHLVVKAVIERFGAVGAEYM